MVAPGGHRAEDSPPSQASPSSSHAAGASAQHNNTAPLLNNYHPLSAATPGGGRAMSGGDSSPMRSFSSASSGLYISAPGKIILFGEHAVVYGRTAIAGSIDLRTYVSLFTSADGQIYLCLPDLDVKKTWMLKDLQKACERLAAECPMEEGPPPLEVIVPIARRLSGACEDQCGVQHLAILAFWYLLIGVVLRKRELQRQVRSSSPPPLSSLNSGEDCSRSHAVPKLSLPSHSPYRSSYWDLLAVKVTVRFKLPACVGLGSSGAFCVCIASALLQTAGIIPPPTITSDDESSLTWDEVHLETIRKWSAAAESLIHGRASGLDAAVCTYGGVASYKPGKRIENLQNVPVLKVILVNSKVERNTSRIVQNVREKQKRFPKIIDSIFDSIDAISSEAAKILQRPLLADENGSGVVENGGRSATLTPSFAGGDSTSDHHNLQPVSTAEQLSRLSFYTAGGKRSSTVSAASGDFRGLSKVERNELTETFEKLNDLSRINNQLLIALGVGHAKVDQICTLLGRYGIHPKMTGAGGGGSVFAFLKPDISQTILKMIRDELKKDGYEMWQPALGGPGVLCHLNRPDIFAAVVSPAGMAETTAATIAVPSPRSSSTSRSNTPASSHQSTPAARHK